MKYVVIALLGICLLFSCSSEEKYDELLSYTTWTQDYVNSGTPLEPDDFYDHEDLIEYRRKILEKLDSYQLPSEVIDDTVRSEKITNKYILSFGNETCKLRDCHFVNGEYIVNQYRFEVTYYPDQVLTESVTDITGADCTNVIILEGDILTLKRILADGSEQLLGRLPLDAENRIYNRTGLVSTSQPYVYEESLYTTQKSKAGAHTQIHIKNKKGKCTIDGNKCSLGKDELAIAVFGRLREHVAIAAMYRFVCGICTVNLAISNLYLETGAQNISYRGDNLRATALELQKTHPEHFQNVISHMQYAFDVEDISIIEEASGRLSIQFHTANEIIPDTLASDGMLSLFAYYLLLEQPLNQTLLCIEEPERNISHEIYTQLSEIIHIKASESNAQIYITTHSPQLISQFKSNEVFFLEKTAQGDSKITHLKHDKILSELLKESSLGELYETNTLSAFTRA